jgi:hypothetical protein
VGQPRFNKVMRRGSAPVYPSSSCAYFTAGTFDLQMGEAVFKAKAFPKPRFPRYSIWKQQLYASIIFAAAILYSLPATAQFDPFAPNRGSIYLGSVERLNQSGIGPELIGGKEAKSSQWPASFYSAQPGSRCSATLVGPTALLLAAHCVGNGQPAAIEFRGKTLSGPCTHADGYQDAHGDLSADYALCSLDDAAEGIQYERLNRDPKMLVLNKKLLLTGFGCTQGPPPSGGPPSGGNDGTFRTGKARIAMLPGMDPKEPNTIRTQDSVVVCHGDSGSGSYLELPGRRVLVSVNSRTWYNRGESLLSSVTSQVALKFFDTWLDRNKGQQICGVNFFAACR